MRRLFFLIVFSCSFQVIAQKVVYSVKELEPVKFIVNYSLNYQQDSSNANDIRHEDMMLLIGSNISCFTSKGYFTLDTLIRKISSRSEYQKYLLDPRNPNIKSRFQSKIFKNYPKNKLTCLDHVIGGAYKYEEGLKMFNWHLTDSTCTIAGFEAQQATCDYGGRNWIAWFSSEISYSDGPYKFNGLSGLIVKIHDSRMHYVYEIKSIERPEYQLQIDYRIKDFISTTKYGFFKAEDSFRMNIVNRVKEAGGDKLSQQIAAQNMAKRNNPIEIKRKR